MNTMMIRQTAVSWLYVVPWGIEKLLHWIKMRYGNPPVIITENGKFNLPSTPSMLFPCYAPMFGSLSLAVRAAAEKILTLVLWGITIFC